MSSRPSPWLGLNASRRASAQVAPERRYEPQPRPDLRVVEDAGQARRRKLTPRARMVASVSAVGALLFALVAFHVVLSQGQFHLERVQNRATEEQAQYDRLRLQVAQLESPERITSEARRLNMAPAESVTALAPTPADIAPGSTAAELPSRNGKDAARDPASAGAWSQIKPHLSSTSR